MKCQYCGSEIDNNAKFCTECGKEVKRERTFLDPFPELDEYRRTRNKFLYVDEKSKPMNIYCLVMIAILVVIMIASFVLKVDFVPILAIIFIVIMLLFLLANNRPGKKIRFAIGRPLLFIFPVLVIQLIVVTVFSYTVRKNSFDDSFFDTGNFESDTIIEELEEDNESLEETAQIVNPIKSVSKEELLAETGISFDDEAVTMEPEYFVISPSDSSDNKIAELRFMIGDREMTYRAQHTEETEAYDTTGLFYEWDIEEEKTIVNCDAKYMKCAEASGMYWLDKESKIDYSLSCIGDMDASQFEGIANLLFDPPSPDDSPVAPAYDYEGTYTNPNGDTVVFVRNEDGTYSIEISILRLCLLEGEANDVDGSAEFSVTDPADGYMTGVYYINPDNTYTVMFTEADWEYIKTGDTFEGFIRD